MPSNRDLARSAAAFRSTTQGWRGVRSYGSGAFKTLSDVRMGGFGAGRLRGMDGRFAAGGFGFEWVGIDNVMANLERLKQGLEELPADVLATLAPEALEYMQRWAPWSDRTGEARANLQSYVTGDQASAMLWLGHGIYYGYYLETMQGGIFGILERTLHEFVIPRMTEEIPKHVAGAVKA